MRMKSAERRTEPAVRELPFENGDRMDQKTFHALYQQCPPGVKAELIGGIVYMPSPTQFRHGRPHARVIHWLASYCEATDGTDVCDNTTNILDEESEPQPDAMLLVLPEYGGQTTLDADDYIVGPCELIAEVSNSSAAIDLHSKRDDYSTAGVLEYFVAVVRARQVVRFVRRGKQLVEKGPDADGVFRSAAFPGLWLNPAGLFGANLRLLRETLAAGLATPEHAAFVAKLEAKRAKLARRKPKT